MRIIEHTTPYNADGFLCLEVFVVMIYTYHGKRPSGITTNGFFIAKTLMKKRRVSQVLIPIFNRARGFHKDRIEKKSQ